MKHKRPKILYSYTNMTLEKHEVTAECLLTPVFDDSTGVRWRCQNTFPRHDFYGYATLQEAKAEEIVQTRIRIVENERWLKKLEGK